MWRNKQQQWTKVTVGLLLGLASAANAATLFEGDLFYTTFQTQSGPAGPNVYKVHFLYDSTPAITLSADCLVASLTGADGLIFDPNDATNKTLIVGEQGANLVASLAVGPLNVSPCPASGVTERKADGTAASGAFNGQAYGLAATPDKSHLWMLPNDPNPNPNHINVAALPLTADGVPNTVTGIDGDATSPFNLSLRGVAFIGTQGYYGDANDYYADGHFGTISSTFVTARVPVVDDVARSATDLNGLGTHAAPLPGSLPTHGMTFDGYSGCIIASGANQIWQICPPGVAGAASDGQFHVRAKIATTPNAGGPPICMSPTPTTATDCNVTNWDQTSTDNAGHMFAANNNGDLLFVDYSGSASKLINNQIGGGPAPFVSEQYLRDTLDDIINGGGAPPPPPTGCPATKGFWANHTWPSNSISIGGITYDGTNKTMTIGGILYTQAKLLSLLPTGSNAAAGGNGLRIGGSQLIAAVLNIANGSPSASIVGTISAMNTLLTGPPQLNLLGSKPAKSINDALIAFGTLLDAYNSSASTLGCVEGTPGTL